MPSKSFRQARMMAGAAHDPVFAKKVGIPMKVAKDFNRADDKSGFLSSAMRAKGPAYQEGGKVSNSQKSRMKRRFADGGRIEERREESNTLLDRLGITKPRVTTKTTYPNGSTVYKNDKGEPYLVHDMSDERFPRHRVQTSFEWLRDKGGLPAGMSKTEREAEQPARVHRPKPPEPRLEDAMNPGATGMKTGGKVKQYAKGGGVKGGGCEKRGARPAKYY